MSEKKTHCADCGAEFLAGDKCRCYMVAAEMDPAREPDAIERLLSTAKKLLQAVETVHEEDEGPMAMPLPEAEALKEAIYDMEDIYAALPYSIILSLRMEMDVARFNASEMFKDENEAISQVQAPVDEEDEPLAADPDTIKKFTAESQEDLAERTLKRIMEHAGPFEAGSKRGLTIKEVIERYQPNVIVKCPDAEDCFSVEKDNAAHCVHAHEHRVDTECLLGCGLYDEASGCKTVEDANEEAIV
jgi:hypothetical protein